MGRDRGRDRGHPSVDVALQEHARLVKAFGQKHGIVRFGQQKIFLDDEQDAWDFVALANRLSESNGGYRADAGGVIVFMTHGTITLATDAE